MVSKLHNSCLIHFNPAAHLPACCQSAHLSALSSVCRLHALVHALMGFPFYVLCDCQLKTLIFVHAFSLRVLRRRWVEEWIVGAVNWREIVQLWSILWEMRLVISAVHWLEVNIIAKIFCDRSIAQTLISAQILVHGVFSGKFLQIFFIVCVIVIDLSWGITSN